MKRVLIYCFSVWITSVFLGPFVYGLITLSPMIDFFVYGFLFSIPSFLISILIVVVLKYINIDVKMKKLIFSAFGILLTVLPLYLLKGGWTQQFIDYGVAYDSVILAGIWFYKVED